MGHCELLGPTLAMSGRVDLHVTREAGGWRARVAPDGLRLHGSAGMWRLLEPFAATLSLKPLPTDP